MAMPKTSTGTPNLSKSFSEEDARDISLMLPPFLVDFTPHTWLIPLGIAVIENKKSHMYRSATMKIDKDSLAHTHQQYHIDFIHKLVSDKLFLCRHIEFLV
jgi:hypothetical protein